MLSAINERVLIEVAGNLVLLTENKMICKKEMNENSLNLMHATQRTFFRPFSDRVQSMH